MSKLLTFRGLNQKEVKLFKEMQKKMLKAGLKTKLPTTIKEYTKQYTGSKQYARDDYYFEWSQVMGKFYNKLGKKALEISKDHKMGYSLNRPTFEKLNTSLQKALEIYNIHLNTLININNKNYLNTNLTDKEKKKLMIKKSKNKIELEGKIYNEVTKAGLWRYDVNRSVSLKDFAGSIVKLAYNNFLIGLSNLGYTKSLTYATNMSVSKWNEIFKKYEDIMEFVYLYRASVNYTKSDEYILWLLMDKNPKDFQGNTVDTLNEYLDDF